MYRLDAVLAIVNEFPSDTHTRVYMYGHAHIRPIICAPRAIVCLMALPAPFPSVEESEMSVSGTVIVDLCTARACAGMCASESGFV